MLLGQIEIIIGGLLQHWSGSSAGRHEIGYNPGFIITCSSTMELSEFRVVGENSESRYGLLLTRVRNRIPGLTL